METNNKKISIILPACNEEEGLRLVLPKLKDLYPEAEIIVVDDGSSDNTESACNEHSVIYFKHPYNTGNGAAIKTGARNANNNILVFMDADGQHDPDDIKHLLEYIDKGFSMVVGSRNRKSQASIFRYIGNTFYNKFSSWIVGHKIDDLTSGFRAVNAEKFREFLYLLPNGFSYPSTITMSFFRMGYSIKYVPIETPKRIGKSHIRPVRDFIKFLLIIFRIGTLYSPLKIFVPVSILAFLLGLLNYIYTFIMYGRFTNMSALLIITSALIFLIGLLSEQITMLIFKKDKY